MTASFSFHLIFQKNEIQSTPPLPPAPSSPPPLLQRRRIYGNQQDCALYLFQLTFETLSLIPPLFELLGDGVLSYMDSTVGRDPVANDTSEDAYFRNDLWLTWYLLDITRSKCVCVCVFE